MTTRRSGIPRVFFAPLAACVAGFSSPCPAEPDALPSLDELLGLEEDSPPEENRELDRLLTAREASEELVQAAQLMEDSAELLAGPRGAGLPTQRIQEDILRKLDKIIESAEQNSGQDGSPSGGMQVGDQQNPPQPGRQQSGGQSQPSRGDNKGQDSAPPLGETVLRPQTLMDAAAWGQLPDRLRGSLQQGLSENFSAAYRRLTESYYRRLAEQAEEEQ